MSDPSLAGPARADAPGLEDPRLYVNRELSLVEFQWRVLDEARDRANPLLERVKFLAIVASNMDEFMMVRVAGLKRQIAAGVGEPSPDGMTPREQLQAVRRACARIQSEMRAVLRDELLPELAEAGIRVVDYGQLDARQRPAVQGYFESAVLPVLTPLAFDPGRPFPHISNLSLNLAILIRDPEGRERFARLKVPGPLRRLVSVERPVDGRRYGGPRPRVQHFVWLEQVIAANLGALFPGMEVVEAHPFRITRDADMVIRELEADDLLETIEEVVRRRRFREVVHVAVTEAMPQSIREILVKNLEIEREDVERVDGPLGLASLMRLRDLDRPELKDPPFTPATPPDLRPGAAATPFAAIRRNDLLLHHPYESFLPVVEFIRRAAHDPRTLALKQTLYRVGRDSPVVQALLEAQQEGKEVTALVELKARFDEESNIEWARALEREGVHVIYGLVGLKTHSKVALVVRKEGSRIRRYVHLSTGNYNAVTAHLYTDLGLLTCDEELGADVTDLFNYITGYSAKTTYRKLLVAPVNLRARVEELIRREMEFGRDGRLTFKMNALVDTRMIQLLYEASRAGVKVDLVVRGICCLRPGVPGVSEHIEVRSIVGRFLEHSRIFAFGNGGAEEIYLGSADLMPRNLDRRVEVMFPVSDPTLVRRLRGILDLLLEDNVKARRMLRDGSYERVVAKEGEPRVDSQAMLVAARPA